jgi:SAM-dependent methyltransferase
MRLLDSIHGIYVLGRRARLLGERLARLLPPHAQVLDVGCGDGRIARLIMQQRPDVCIEGVDTIVRPQTHIPVMQFDGRTIPLADGSRDVVMFVDVLHHTEDPMILLREALRVARAGLLIKDHCLDGWLAGPTLRFMDRVGNARHGVALPFNYWPEARWREAFATLGLDALVFDRRIVLYPPPANWIFGRGLQFVSRLALRQS